MDTAPLGFDCSICLEPFDDPRLLSCGHTFCLRCLVKLPQKTVGIISCPLRDGDTLVPSLDQLKKNYAIIDAFETIQKIQPVGPQVKQKCTVLQEDENSCIREATKFCGQCDHYFCNQCFASDHNGRLFAKHLVTSPPWNSLSEKKIPCSKHPKEETKFYCFECKALFCVECVITHNGHKFEKIEIAVISTKQPISQIQEQITKQYLSSIHQALIEKEKEKAEIEKRLQKVNMEIENLTNANCELKAANNAIDRMLSQISPTNLLSDPSLTQNLQQYANDLLSKAIQALPIEIKPNTLKPLAQLPFVGKILPLEQRKEKRQKLGGRLVQYNNMLCNSLQTSTFNEDRFVEALNNGAGPSSIFKDYDNEYEFEESNLLLLALRYHHFHLLSYIFSLAPDLLDDEVVSVAFPIILGPNGGTVSEFLEGSLRPNNTRMVFKAACTHGLLRLAQKSYEINSTLFDGSFLSLCLFCAIESNEREVVEYLCQLGTPLSKEHMGKSSNGEIIKILTSFGCPMSKSRLPSVPSKPKRIK